MASRILIALSNLTQILATPDPFDAYSDLLGRWHGSNVSRQSGIDASCTGPEVRKLCTGHMQER